MVFGLGADVARAEASPTTVAHAPTLGEARAAMRGGRHVEAERAFRALLAAGEPRGRLGLARVFLDTGRYAEAERTADEAVRVGAHLAAATTLLGEAHEAQGKLDAAEGAYARAAALPEALRARVRLGRLLLARGRPQDGEPHLRSLIAAYNDDALGPDRPAALAYVAMAARALGSVHDANDAFREAALADRARVETQLEWARLFLQKHDLAHAAECVEEALEHNPRNAEAHAWMARIEIERSFDFPAASAHLDLALAVNPHLVAAHVTRAAMALRSMEIEEADRHLDLALAVNPSDLEALAVRAAVRFLADDRDGFERAKREAFARNPRFSGLYAIIARYAEWEHRYDELVAMARDALRLDPSDSDALTTLGLNLLRTGDEAKGLEVLRRAWEHDRFNVLVFNTLNLYDEVVSKQYVKVEAPPFIVRMQREERPALEPYLVSMLRRAHRDMQDRYHFTPRAPVHVELYADRQSFSVRTTGLPNIGVQGVCFGKVVTAISPRAGPFNWGQITWHELAHVFHLQLSRNRVPRWFTEGLAEYETTIARPEWKREEDYDLWVALGQGRVPPLGRLNRAFTDARTPDDLMTAYYASYVAVRFLIERFGFDKVRPMLVAWGEGKRTPEVVRSVLGVSLDALDQEFTRHLRQRLARFDGQFHVDFSRYADLAVLRREAAARPNDATALAGLALGELMEKNYEAAERAAEAAIRIAPQQPLAHFALTRVALEQNDVARAERSLRAILAGGTDGHILRVLLARAALAQSRAGDALREAELAAKLDPDRLESYRVMLDAAEKLGDPAVARRSLEALVALDQHDRITHLGLMALLDAARADADLVRVGESALYLDPENPQVHKLLAEGLLRTHAPARALTEFDRALALRHPRPGSVHLGRARSLSALGRRAEAQAAARAAVAADARLAGDVERILREGR